MATGTFRLEVKGTLADDKPRDKFDADHDGMYWTSQLSANSTGEEVITGWIWDPHMSSIYCSVLLLQTI